MAAAEREGIGVEAQTVNEDDPFARHERVRALIARMTEPGAVLCLGGALSQCAAGILRQSNAQGRIALAGFDCDQTYIDCLVDETARFTVLRAPLAIGYRGVECAMNLVYGRIAEPVQYVDATMVMSEDALDSKYAHLTFPLIH